MTNLENDVTEDVTETVEENIDDVEKSTVEEDEEEEVEEVEEEELSDDEKELMAERIRELEEKNKKLAQKVKQGYKKWVQKIHDVKQNYVSKDDVKKIFDEIQSEKKAEATLLEKYEDAKEILPEIQKIKDEKWLSIDEAYALVKGKMFTDEWYRNQILGDRSSNYGSFMKWDINKASPFGKWPKISQPRDN